MFYTYLNLQIGDLTIQSNLEAQQLFAEEMGLYFEKTGLTRTAGRILGWLLICDPPYQTMHELVDALQVSKSSISTASRTLMQADLLERISLPGQRRDYYQIPENVWSEAMRQRMSYVTVLRQLAERGLELLADAPSQRKARLQDMHDLYAFFEREIPTLIERWEKERNRQIDS